MDILSLIKDKLTDTVIEKVSNFLGEHPENIGSALNSAVPIVLGGIVRNASNDEDTAKVMDVLKDGGHTGEILDDLPNLLGNFDKTQLLITIGSNIFNHFTGNKSNAIVEKLSSLTGIRKTSASSLVGLAAPLVLGALGKVVAKEGLGVSGLTKLLSDQRESVFGALPPAIANQLNFKSDTNAGQTSNEAKPKEIKNDTTQSRGFLRWIPWVLIGLLFLAGLAYFWKYRKSTKVINPVTDTVGVLPKQDSTYVNDAPFTPPPSDTIGVVVTTETPKVKETKSVEKIEKETKKVEKSSKTDFVEEKTKETPKTDIFDSNTSNISVSEQLKTNKSWIGLSADFKKNSAEMSSKSGLDDVVKFLKTNKKAKIIIAGGSQSTGGTLAEDRAYAVRDALLERGIAESRVSAQSSSVRGVNAKVVVKVK